MSISEPAKITTPWANTGSKNPIPANANNTTGAAGFDKGFPDITMTPEEAGGIPPAGQDFNGIFYQITDIIRYMQAGGTPTFDQDLATAIGGYPVGAIVSSTDGKKIWQNRVNGNLTPPGTSSSGWASITDIIYSSAGKPQSYSGFSISSGSFQAGGTLSSSIDCMIDESTGIFYTGSGPFPQVVSQGTNPETATGFEVASFEQFVSSGMVNVFRYLNPAERAAVMSGNYGPIATVSHAIDAAIADIGSGTYPVNAKGLWFPNGAWIIDKPVRSKIPLEIDGDAARLIASPAFIGATLNDGGSSVVVKAMMVFVPDDNYNTISGPQAQGMSVGRGITLHGGDVVDAGVYTERMVCASYNMRVDYAKTPVIVGPYSWGLNLDNIILENFDTHGIHFKTNAAANGCSISTPRIWGRFKNPVSALFFDTDAECNGVHVSGGFLEKVGYAGLHSPGSGTCHYDAVDMEQCANTTVRVIGNDPNSVPVIISGGCFLDSPVYRVYVDNCTVEIENSRLHGENGGLNFYTTSTGKIVATNNRYYQGVYAVAPGSRVIFKDAVSVSDDRIAMLPSASPTMSVVSNDAQRNNEQSPNLNTSNIVRFSKQLSPGSTESQMDFYVTAINAGEETRVAGIRATVDGGANSVLPIYDNVTSLGSATYRYSVVYSAAGVITTSDGREKTEPRELNDALLDVGDRIEIITHQWLHAIALKGEDFARWHFGVIAQQVRDAFADRGLDGRDYGLLCYDSWDDTLSPVLDEDGRETDELYVSNPAGDRWGIRPDQCMWLCMAAMRRRLSRIEERMDKAGI